MARVLLLTQVLPYPLDSGAKVRACHMLRHLSQRHQVALVSFTRPDDPPRPLPTSGSAAAPSTPCAPCSG